MSQQKTKQRRRFIPLKPKSTFFEVKELFNKCKPLITDGVFVEPYYNGNRIAIEKRDGEVTIHFEDSDRDCSRNFPILTKAIQSMKGDFILDGVAIAKGEKDSAAVRVFDLLYHSECGELINKTLRERWNSLCELVPETIHIRRAESWEVRTQEHLKLAVDEVNKTASSYGAVIKTARSLYTNVGSTSNWMKLRKLRKLRTRVIEKTNDSLIMGVMVANDDVSKYKNVREVDGRHWVSVGVAKREDQDHDVGTDLHMEVAEILVNKTQKKTQLSWMLPFIRKIADSPMTVTQFESRARPWEIKRTREELGLSLNLLHSTLQKSLFSDDNFDTGLYDLACPENNLLVKSGKAFFDQNVKAKSKGTFTLIKHTIGKGSHWDLRMQVEDKDLTVGFMIPGSDEVDVSKELSDVSKELVTQFKSYRPGAICKGSFDKVETGTWRAGKQDKNFKEFVFEGRNGIVKGRFVVKGVDKNEFQDPPNIPSSQIFFLEKSEDNELELEKEEEQQKRVFQVIDKDLIFWGTQEALMGTTQAVLMELAKLHDVDRKFVTVERPSRRVVDFLVENYKVESASYSDLSDGDDFSGYTNLVIRDKAVDAFIIEAGYPKLVLFFDDKREIEKIFGEEENKFRNYKHGTYNFVTTMHGYHLERVKNENIETPILDDKIMENLVADTEKFFSNRKFYKEHGLPHKRGVLLVGPPGNGKTTFIKNYVKSLEGMYAIVIDSTNQVSSSMFQFLDQTLGNEPKVIVFEDVDSVVQSYRQRSEFLNFLDGITQLDNTLVVATTNYPQRLDPALMRRRSRFDRIYKIDYPNEVLRGRFLKRWFEKLGDEELETYAKRTEGFSGADFKELFILTNIQGSTVDEAIEQMLEQIDLTKRKSDLLLSDAAIGNGREIRQSNLEIFKGNGPEQEERITYGIVLKPNDVDAHEDIYDGPTIVKAADFYMEKFANTGLMHRLIVNKKIKILQSYTALTDFTITDQKGRKRKIKKDTWLMKFRVLDDDIWNRVKSGELTGLSIGALATIRELRKVLKELQAA